MQYPGKAPPPFVETHRLAPDALSREGGLAPIDPSTVAMLRAIGRRPPPRDRVRFTLALALALVFHIVLIFLVRYEMQPRPLVAFAVPTDKDEVMEVRFIEPTPPAPAVANAPPPPPVAEPPPKVRSREATRPEPPQPKKEEPAPPAEAPAPAPTLNLFGKDGSIAMPKAGAPTQADFVPPKPNGDAQIMSHKTTVTYKETRFEKDWAPRDENIVNQGLRKAVEKTTVKKTIDFGHGVRVNCATVFFVLPAGCSGEDPSKASAKVGDSRLNMAPAKPLASDPNAPPPPSEAECVASYRRNETVMAGCPSDTPLKAMDQENAERAHRTGQ
ncbi:MAG: hypothetical protein GAK28_02664 [Luteibacter sp.]|uniref:hypothetical protein n=1 Tax=Luteibacter sp. TaxID=1886636 RepID=UPI0013818D06|nr:hypothetical protein [Luteibacter sp.]KAF1006353.1 MAG: hypothetical protein GAK28_02664 [Luteibacter sp.]